MAELVLNFHRSSWIWNNICFNWHEKYRS